MLGEPSGSNPSPHADKTVPFFYSLCIPFGWGEEQRDRGREGGREKRREKMNQKAQRGLAHPCGEAFTQKPAWKQRKAGGEKRKEKENSTRRWLHDSHGLTLVNYVKEGVSNLHSTFQILTHKLYIMFFISPFWNVIKGGWFKRCSPGTLHPAGLNSSANLTHLAQIFRWSWRHSLAGSGLLDFGWIQSP